jgi:hypothetical protein
MSSFLASVFQLLARFNGAAVAVELGTCMS